MRAAPLKALGRYARRGFTLIELMIALLVGLFLLGALLTIVQANKQVFGNQNLLAQVQDNERMAMTMITDVIQSAGYFSNPIQNTLTLTFQPSGAFTSGQAITGTYSAAPPGDTISVRYWTDTAAVPSDVNILNCSGIGNTTGGQLMMVNTFAINASGQLVCTMNGTPYTLVGDGAKLTVTNMSVLYGVKDNVAAAGNNVDTYMNAAQVTAAGGGPPLGDWNNVISVLITLTFTNPLFGPSDPKQPPTVSIQRVIGLMNQTGPIL
ncbi:MAG TPA: prepilin-type N-terminal cleavage/methylation domain-containing protein [Steroidobacteraceae bacterium]|nr:prepilin-type N-terminal cleavage/methylation domain-containing protein [Steroidobacteraceae bacterium]